VSRNANNSGSCMPVHDSNIEVIAIRESQYNAQRDKLRVLTDHAVWPVSVMPGQYMLQRLRMLSITLAVDKTVGVSMFPSSLTRVSFAHSLTARTMYEVGCLIRRPKVFPANTCSLSSSPTDICTSSWGISKKKTQWAVLFKSRIKSWLHIL
jgi:hypothetical protein